MISAKIIADSKNEKNDRITTMEVVMPRMILAEFNTHRMFSRNSASSRAIPFKKMVKMVKENPFIPYAWMKDHSGMQGNHYFKSSFKKWTMRRLWLMARTLAVIMATLLNKNGLTKQLCNRLLEPFMWHTVLVTATEWENFFVLRMDGAAEIHMQALATSMKEAYVNSIPKLLRPGEWHMPYFSEEDFRAVYQLVYKNGSGITDIRELSKEIHRLGLKISTARSARLSYYTLGDSPKIDYNKDFKLHDNLAENGHWSPFEHCAVSMSEVDYMLFRRRNKQGETDEGGWCGNFRGFIPYRKRFDNENITA